MLIAVIPFYNEQEAIRPTIRKVVAAFPSGVKAIVVNDGSDEASTASLLDASREHPGVIEIIRHGTNLGVRKALASGYLRSVALARKDDVILCLEGDDTNIADFRLMAELIETGEADIVIASRYRPGGEFHGFPAHRRFLSNMGNSALRLLYPYPNLTDYSMFCRAVRGGLLKRVLPARERKAFFGRSFAANASLLLSLLHEHPKIREVPLTYRYDSKLKKSSFRPSRVLPAYLMLPLVFPPWANGRRMPGPARP